ncbi:MAG: 2-isopropylmalate synthase [Puniceicoccaceae bacterium]|nr:MAG: 2-isopropylmalate synthase [Puniceicoccaceae bacterium]
MQPPPITKYRPFPRVDLPDRQWPDRTIDQPPLWCSVDLRDGNQALAVPMSVEQKLELFDTLVQIGFKEIEVGFPAASSIEFEFIRRLIDENRIPDDVTIQVLTQSREELIARTFESLAGVKRAILHLYNSTSPVQREVVFGLDREEIKAIAVRGTRQVRQLADAAIAAGSRIVFQYSPESFSDTELDFALDVCEAVTGVWGPSPEDRIILNLPATVEVSTPNIHADQIEWFCRHLSRREEVIISLHAHNDRGTAVAATELGLMAGADRVEGTLFGNGERTGNVDIVTLALNLYTQGVHPGLDFSNLNAVREVYERCTRMEVPPRQPYGGELVFTAFSGSHQDAIKKGMARQDEAPGARWRVPYLPIDPKDIGRNYRAIIRINSQSGKGGVAYVMEAEFGFILPKAMHRELGRLVNEIADSRGLEITPDELYAYFVSEYIERHSPLRLVDFSGRREANGTVSARATVEISGELRQIEGKGNGPIAAFVHGLAGTPFGGRFELLSYAEHSLGVGADSKAVAYIQIRTDGGYSCFGAGMDTNIEIASIQALVSALNRAGLVS